MDKRFPRPMQARRERRCDAARATGWGGQVPTSSYDNMANVSEPRPRAPQVVIVVGGFGVATQEDANAVRNVLRAIA